jgi:hypothetical protein
MNVIVYFGHDKSLRDVIFFEPQWLMDMFSSVLTLKHRLVRDGILLHKDLFLIWFVFFFIIIHCYMIL